MLIFSLYSTIKTIDIITRILFHLHSALSSIGILNERTDLKIRVFFKDSIYVKSILTELNVWCDHIYKDRRLYFKEKTIMS